MFHSHFTRGKGERGEGAKTAVQVQLGRRCQRRRQRQRREETLAASDAVQTPDSRITSPEWKWIRQTGTFSSHLTFKQTILPLTTAAAAAASAVSLDARLARQEEQSLTKREGMLLPGIWGGLRWWLVNGSNGMKEKAGERKAKNVTEINDQILSPSPDSNFQADSSALPLLSRTTSDSASGASLTDSICHRSAMQHKYGTNSQHSCSLICR